MRFKTFIFSFLPALLFFFALLLLSSSSLTVTKAIDLQSELLLSFFSKTVETNVVGGLKSFLSLVWQKVMLPIIPCFLLVTFSISLIVTQNESFNRRFFLVSCVILFPLLFFLTESIPIALGFVGCVLAGVLVSVQEEPSFSLGFHEVSSKLRVFYLLLIIGLFVVMYLKFDTYKERIEESNLNLLFSFVPNVSKLQEAQKEQLESFIQQTGEGFKSSIANQYSVLPQDIQQKCKPLYDSVVAGIDEYKEEAVKRIKVKKYEVSEEEMKRLILQAFPAFEGIVKVTPLTTSILAFTFLEVVRFLFGIVGSILVFIVSKFKD